MSMQESIMPTTCARCGEPFNTSREHPRDYCSIACEEGRSPLPVSDPSSDGYHLHLQGNPDALVGEELLAVGLKRTCYSPDWHRSPSSYSRREIVSHDRENEILVVESDVYLGRVTEYDSSTGEYVIEREDVDRGEISIHEVDASLAVDQIRRQRWWVG